MGFSFNPVFWFICRSCKEVFPNTDDLKNHKLKQHLGDCLTMKCMVFEEQFVDNAWTPLSRQSTTQLSSNKSVLTLKSNAASFNTNNNDQHSHQAEVFQNPYVSLIGLPATPSPIEYCRPFRKRRIPDIQSLSNPQDESQLSKQSKRGGYSQLNSSSNAIVLKERPVEVFFPFSSNNPDNTVVVKSEAQSPLELNTNVNIVNIKETLNHDKSETSVSSTESDIVRESDFRIELVDPPEAIVFEEVSDFDSNSGHFSTLRLTEPEQITNSLSQAESDPLARITESDSVTQTESESNTLAQEDQKSSQPLLLPIPIVTPIGTSKNKTVLSKKPKTKLKLQKPQHSIVKPKATRKKKPKRIRETEDIVAIQTEDETGLEPGSLSQNPNSNLSKELVSKVSQKPNTTNGSSLPFSCPICSASFPNKSLLKKHRIVHPSINSFKCTHEQCVRAFRTEAGLQRHLREHKSKIGSDSESNFDTESKCDLELPLLQWLLLQEDKNPANIILLDPDPHTGDTFNPVDQSNPVKCKWCQECFVSELNLRLHASKCFVFNKKKHRYCQECDKSFHSPYAFRSHISTVHATSPRPSFKCSLCSKEFLKEKVFKFHQSTHNLPLESSRDRDKQEEPEPERQNQDKNNEKLYFECQFCDKVFMFKCQLEDHERTHTGDKPFKCTVENCGRAYGRKESLRKHQMMIHMIELGLQKFLCPTCGKGFPQKYLMNAHISIQHSQDKPFKCSFVVKKGQEGDEDTVCSKAFKYREQMLVHVRVDHTGELPYQCYQCGKAYARSGSLDRHIKMTHEGMRRDKVACLICPRRFKGNYEMKKHMKKTHETEKTFPCQVCGIVAASKACLKRHVKTHGKEDFVKDDLQVEVPK